ncbi:MAG: DUF421 domain-containing protein [Acidimicrobiales bacterium]
MHPTLMYAVIGKDLWSGIPILEKAIRTAGVYAGILILLRVAGKRDLAQLDSFDLVVLLLLSNVVQNAIIGNDTSLSGGLLGAALLVAVNAVVVRVARASDRGVRVFEGSPTVLVSDGQHNIGVIRRLGLRRSDVTTALRRQGANDVDEVAEAVLEPGGAIVVTLKPEEETVKVRDLARLEAKLDALLEARGN